MTQLAAYSFDESGDVVTDYSGNGNDFSLVGTKGVRVTAGHTNGGLTKTADSSASFNLAQMPNLPIIGLTAHRTVMAWVKGTGGVWWIIWHSASINSGSWGILNLSQAVGIQARSVSTLVRPSTPVPTDGLWHHYTGTYDGATVRLYRDGVLVNSATLAGPLRTDVTTLAIMEWVGSTTVMDDVRIFDEVLDLSAIAEMRDTPVVPPDTALARYWDGSAWVDASTVRHFTGAAWVDVAALRHFDGLDWV